MARSAEHDERYPIKARRPEVYMVRFGGGLSDYELDEHPQTVGVMRNVTLEVLLVCAVLVRLGFLLM